MASFSFFTDLITPTKYKVPDWSDINPTTIQDQTNTGNAASFAGAKQLASDYNDFMRQQVQKSLQANVPGYSGITDQISKNIQSGLKGELFMSDVAASQRASAATNLGLGTAGSPFGGALTARDLGLKQFQLQQNAQQQGVGYLGALSQITKAPMYDFSNVFLSPAQRIQTAFQNQSNQWNIQNLRNQMAVQPEPWAKALAKVGDTVLDAVANYYTGGTFSMMGSSSGGSGKGGGGGGGGGMGDLGNSFFG